MDSMRGQALNWAVWAVDITVDLYPAPEQLVRRASKGKRCRARNRSGDAVYRSGFSLMAVLLKMAIARWRLTEFWPGGYAAKGCVSNATCRCCGYGIRHEQHYSTGSLARRSCAELAA